MSYGDEPWLSATQRGRMGRTTHQRRQVDDELDSSTVYTEIGKTQNLANSWAHGWEVEHHKLPQVGAHPFCAVAEEEER
jgi:hypothetical protein